MLKRISIIFFVFFLCISFLKADCFSPKDSSGGFLVPFSIKNLTPAMPDIGNANDRDVLIDSLSLFADELGKRLNGTILIARHDTILVEKAYGYLHLYRSCDGYGWMPASELEKRRHEASNAMTPGSVFELASVSKQFTAAAILKLCREGKMSLDDSITMYFPRLPYREATVRHLLTHTSGLPEYFNFEYKIYDTATFITNDELMRVLTTTKPQRMFLTGQGYTYGNTNYALLVVLNSPGTTSIDTGLGNNLPVLVVGCRLEGDGEDRILIDVLSAMLELPVFQRIAVPTIKIADEIVSLSHEGSRQRHSHVGSSSLLGRTLASIYRR